MRFPSAALDWRTVLRRLEDGNRRYAAGVAWRREDSGGRPIAAVACPARWTVPPERLFDLAPGDLYILQGDLAEASPDLVAGVEWAAALGIRLVIVLGSPRLCDELAMRMAPHDMTIVEAVIGPNGRVRFSPRGVPAAAQILRSR